MTCKSTVAILAGGMGTRLSERSGDLPKPMMPIGGKPVLQHQIELCGRSGFTDIVLLVQHRHERISEYFGDGRSYGVRLTYAIEDYPRGTAGALRDALSMLADRFLVLYGDTFLDVDLRKIWDAHARSGASATLFLHPNDHPQDSDLVDIDSDGSVRAILPYPHPSDRQIRNLVNAALYVIDRTGIEDVTPSEGKADIAKDMFPRMLELGRRLYGYVSPEYIKDMGTPERLDRVEYDFALGIPELLSGRQLRKAVFLDRDGTINREVTHLKKPDQIELLPGAASAIRRLNQSGILAVVITNQPVIARGEVSFEMLNRIHARLDSHLGIGGAYLNGLYVCPHHPDKGFVGEIAELKYSCLCRKPEPGLIDQACRDLIISRQDSWFIGDMSSDVEAGRRAGVRTILVLTGHGGADAKWAVRPDYFALDLEAAVEWILDGHNRLLRRLAPIAFDARQGRRLFLVGGMHESGTRRAAQVLKEITHFLGYKAHVISLDSWLKQPASKKGELGLQERLNFKSASSDIAAAICSNSHSILSLPIYDHINGTMSSRLVDYALGPSDILIIEGLSALLLDSALMPSDTVKIFMKGFFEEGAEVLTPENFNNLSTVEEICKIADYVID